MDRLLTTDIAPYLFTTAEPRTEFRTHKIHARKENSQEENDSQNYQAQFLIRKSLKHCPPLWRNSNTLRLTLPKSDVATS